MPESFPQRRLITARWRQREAGRQEALAVLPERARAARNGWIAHAPVRRGLSYLPGHVAQGTGVANVVGIEATSLVIIRHIGRTGRKLGTRR